MLNTLFAGIVIGFVGCLYYVATKKQKASKGDKGEAVKGPFTSVFQSIINAYSLNIKYYTQDKACF